MPWSVLLLAVSNQGPRLSRAGLISHFVAMDLPSVCAVLSRQRLFSLNNCAKDFTGLVFKDHMLLICF